MGKALARVSRVAIVGVGLIGGSLGMAWRRKRSVDEIIGVVRDPGTIPQALERGAIDRGTTDLAEGVREADLVVVATPVGVTIEMAALLAPHLKAGAWVTDVGSTKLQVMASMERALPPGVAIVGGHPMAGSERAGIAAADPFLFENAIYVLTPAPGTPDGVVAGMEELVKATGAQPVLMDPREHDLMVAAVSHLPQLAAVALVRAVSELNREHEGILALAAGGFRDTTRVAGSQPGIWKDICLSNREMILEALARYRQTLDRLEELVRDGREEELVQELSRAREVRESIPNRAKGLLPKLHEIGVVCEDRPGVIGHISTSLGAAGINISDIEILRQREGEGGTIRLGFTSPGMVDPAIEVLRREGYQAWRR